MKTPLAGFTCGLLMLVAIGASAPAQAQNKTVAATQCLFSGPVGAMAGGPNGDPVRYDIDADGRAVLLIHKVQTNYDVTNPFKEKIFTEKPTCRLKLDCVVAKQGLKDIGVQSTRNEPGGDPNIWTRVGFSVSLKYDSESQNKSCRIVAIDSL